ncbi:MAG: hypothetical protein R3C99_26410 [Pirellulaceae bacterium]
MSTRPACRPTRPTTSCKTSSRRTAGSGSFADWQAFSGGQDVLSLVIPQTSVATELNNLFVDPSAGDFHLRAGSAAIDVGDPFHTAPTDILATRDPAARESISAARSWSVLADRAVRVGRLDRVSSSAWPRSLHSQRDTEQPLAVFWFDRRHHGRHRIGRRFQGVDGYLVFRPGESRKTFRIFIHDDAAIESREAVRLDLRVVGDPTGLIPIDQVGDPTGLIPTDQVGDPTGVGDPVGVGDPDLWMPDGSSDAASGERRRLALGTIEFDSRST